MRVKCVINDLGKISDEGLRRRLSDSVHYEGPDRDLTIGETYTVFALGQWIGGEVKVYLHTVSMSDHPYPYPIELFEVVDATLPANWCIGFERTSSEVSIKTISFPEWAMDDSFYERLIDGDEEAVEIYKAQM